MLDGTVTSNVFLASVVAGLAAYDTILQSANVETELKIDEAHGKLVVEFKGNRILGILQAWEHAHCMDFDYMQLPSGEIQMMFAGECENSDTVAEHLRSVVDCVVEIQHGGTR